MKKPICAPAQSSSRRSPRRDFQKTGAIKKDATVKRTAMKAKVEECFRAPVTTTKVAPQKSEHRARERSAFNRWLMRKPLHKASRDRKSTRLNSSHMSISYAVFCLKKKKKKKKIKQKQQKKKQQKTKKQKIKKK